MKKEHILALLFFGGVWGICEAVLGDALYTNNVPNASVPLTVIGFIVMSLALVYLPKAGTATVVACFAMLYKFLNEPFFACHILGIVLLGISYDLFFSVFKVKNRAICAGLAAYVGYALFAFMITYLFRYEHWVQGGIGKVVRHIGISGTMAAIGCAVLVPLAFNVGEKFKSTFENLFELRFRLPPAAISLVVAGLWGFAVVSFLLQHRSVIIIL